MYRALLLAAGLIAGSACDNATEPVSTDPRGISLQVGTPPATSGVVARTEEIFLYALPGVKSNMTALVGTTTPLTETCDPDIATFTPVAVTVVFTPSGRLVAADRGVDMPVVVYGGFFHFGFENFCEIASAAPVLATGTVRLRFMTKEVDPATGPGSFTNQFRINGLVTLTSGGLARLHGAVTVVVTPQGEERVDERLSLIPVGGG